MKQNQWLCVSVLLAAALSPAGALAIGRVLPQDVKDLSAGVRNCTGRGVLPQASKVPANTTLTQCASCMD